MIILSVVLYSFLLVKLRFKAKITSGTLANMCNYVRFYAYVAWMINVNVIVYDLEVDSAPHKNVHSLNHELKNRGFQTLASDDDFDKSFTCTTCGVKLTYQDKAKAVRLLKRHASEKSHQVKAGWYLDANNNVLASKPRGKSKLLNCVTSQGGNEVNFFVMDPSIETVI